MWIFPIHSVSRTINACVYVCVSSSLSLCVCVYFYSSLSTLFKLANENVVSEKKLTKLFLIKKKERESERKDDVLDKSRIKVNV